MTKSVLILGGLGYIGSRVYQYLLGQGFDCYSTDLQLFGDGLGFPNLRKNFADLNEGFIQEFDAVINLAGHSSVPSCDLNQEESLINNVVNFVNLVAKLRKDQKFIYASSGSVYGNMLNAKETDILGDSAKRYDSHKQIIDNFFIPAPPVDIPDKWYGLRFGTVCGYSPNPRNELMINSMVKSARLKTLVRVSSPESFRSILGMNDLCRAIDHILDNDSIEAGIYNLASFYDKIGRLGSNVAKLMEARLETSEEETSHYSFSLNTEKFEATGFEFLENTAMIARECIKNDFSVERNWKISL